MKSWLEYDAEFESRIERYREAARLFRSAAETMSAERRADIFELATVLEGFAEMPSSSVRTFINARNFRGERPRLHNRESYGGLSHILALLHHNSLV